MEETLRKILEAAKALAPVVEGLTGTSYAGPAISAARSVIELIDGLKHTATSGQSELQAVRNDLEASVMAHADRTISDLRGDK